MDTSDSDAQGSATSQIDRRFRRVGRKFSDSFEALRETHEELSPAAEKLDLIAVRDASLFPPVEHMSEEDVSLFSSALDEVIKPDISITELANSLLDKLGETDWGPSFIYKFIHRIMRPRREPIFHGAILTSIVAIFEAYLAEVSKEYYRASPDALHNLPRESQKEFSLRELQNLNSIEDAVEVAIDNRVDKLMFGSLSDWKKFFSDRLKIRLDNLVEDWESIREIFERRHCIVHNQARASRRYVANHPQIELNEYLQPSSGYVRDAADQVELLGVLLLVETWEKFSNKKQNIVNFLEEVSFAALKEERWKFSLQLYGKMMDISLTDRDKRMAQVNIFIAQKGIKGLEVVSPDVEAWDVSSLDELFIFAKFCLMEELEEAFRMLPNLVESGKIVGNDLATWPLLAPLRSDPRIHQYWEIMRNHLNEMKEPIRAEIGEGNHAY